LSEATRIEAVRAAQSLVGTAYKNAGDAVAKLLDNARAIDAYLDPPPAKPGTAPASGPSMTRRGNR
jgi:hypothetical protein